MKKKKKKHNCAKYKNLKINGKKHSRNMKKKKGECREPSQLQMKTVQNIACIIPKRTCKHDFVHKKLKGNATFLKVSSYSPVRCSKELHKVQNHHETSARVFTKSILAKD